MTNSPSAGQLLLEKLTSTTLFSVMDPNDPPNAPEKTHIIIWSSGAAEQLDAMVHEVMKHEINALENEIQRLLNDADDHGKERDLLE